jgi:hypothetical protein
MQEQQALATFATPLKYEAHREPERTSDTPDAVPSVTSFAPGSPEHEYNMLSFGFDTSIRSVNIHSSPTVHMTNDDVTSYNIVSIDPIATADANYLTDGGKDLVILEIKPQEIVAPIENRGHIDGGALASTIHQSSFLHDLKLYTSDHPSPIRLVTADNERFAPKGVGYLHVPSGEIYHDFHCILCFWCPEIPSCIISPHSFEALHDSGRCIGVTITQNHDDGTCVLTSASSLVSTHNIILEGIVVNKMCDSPELLAPNKSATFDPASTPIDTPTVSSTQLQPDNSGISDSDTLAM